MKTKDDIRLAFLHLANTDDGAVLWELHTYFFHRLFRLIYSIVRQKEAAEELTNDVFIQLWKSRQKLQHIENPEVYLFVCAKNRAYAHLKAKKPITDSLDDLRDFDLQLERSPEDILISSEMVQRINAAIRQLPPKCKLIFLLIKENNLKYREVAEILDISEKTVETQMNIAFKKLCRSIPFALPAIPG